jgi:hypothetical protein
MADQSWVPDPTLAAALRADILDAQDRSAAKPGVDPNADLLAQARGDLINAFRVSNPQIYDGLRDEFNKQFSGAVCEGIRMGHELAMFVIDSALKTAKEDEDGEYVVAYLESITQSLKTVFDKAQKELGGNGGG